MRKLPDGEGVKISGWEKLEAGGEDGVRGEEEAVLGRPPRGVGGGERREGLGLSGGRRRSSREEREEEEEEERH